MTTQVKTTNWNEAIEGFMRNYAVDNTTVGSYTVEHYLIPSNDLTDRVFFKRFVIDPILRLEFKSQEERYDKAMLDYGCGNGRFAAMLAHWLGPHKLYAVDISDQAVHQAERNLRPYVGPQSCFKESASATVRKIEDHDLSFIEDDSLDLAMLNFVMQTIKSDEEVKRIVTSICPKLRRTGRLVVMDTHPDTVDAQFFSFRREKPATLEENCQITTWLTGMTAPIYDYWRSKGHYLSLLKESGFEHIKVHEPVIIGHEDEEAWRDERKVPPYLILEGRKAQ